MVLAVDEEDSHTSEPAQTESSLLLSGLEPSNSLLEEEEFHPLSYSSPEEESLSKSSEVDLTQKVLKGRDIFLTRYCEEDQDIISQTGFGSSFTLRNGQQFTQRSEVDGLCGEYSNETSLSLRKSADFCQLKKKRKLCKSNKKDFLSVVSKQSRCV